MSDSNANYGKSALQFVLLNCMVCHKLIQLAKLVHCVRTVWALRALLTQ